MDNDGNRRMDELIMNEFDPTIYEPLRREDDDELLDKVIPSPACTIRFALTLMTVTTISLDDRQTVSKQSDGVPLPVLQRRPPFGSALHAKRGSLHT